MTSVRASHAENDSVDEARNTLPSDTPNARNDVRHRSCKSHTDAQRAFSSLAKSLVQALLDCVHLPILAKCRVAAGIGASLLILGGCAGEETFGLASQWREGVAMSIVRQDAIPEGTSLQCISRPPNSAAHSRDALIAIVRMHIGRAPFDEAFEIPQGAALRTGDAVHVQPRLCLLRETSKTGASETDRTSPIRSE